MGKQIKLITLDTETYKGLTGSLKRIAIYDGKEVHYGYTFADIEHILINYKSMGFQVHVYIHNVEFDLRKIPEVFDRERVVWENSLMINGKIATLHTRNYIIHDSMKILPMALAKASKDFQVEHGKLDLWNAVRETYPKQYEVYNKKGEIDTNASLVNFLDKCDKDDPLYLEYLGYDVISLYEVLQELMKVSGLSLNEFVKRVSTASLSRHLFKKGYKDKIFKDPKSSRTDYEMLCLYKWGNHDGDEEIEEFLRDSYAGGRVEVFKPRLSGGGFHDDVNSLYPSQMGGEFPIGRPYFTKKPNLAEHYYTEWKRKKKGLGFINAHVFIPFQEIPPLPVKKGKLMFPCGDVYGTWTYEELEYAESECGVIIKEYFACCHFNQTYPVFRRFIEEMYTIKEDASKVGNEALRTFAKLIMNVGYGYTGMRRDDKTELLSFDELETYKQEGKKIVFADKEMGFIEVPTEITSEYIQVQVASYVTSRARLVLLKGLRSIIKRGGTVYYCDTDSIVSDIGVSPELKDPTKLGFWDEESRPVSAVFLRPKVYAEIHEKKAPTIKFKGVSKETQKELDFDYYNFLYEELEKGEKEYEVVEKNRLTMRSLMYMQKNSLDMGYYEERDKKMNFNTVEKRIMEYKENVTSPYFFDGLDSFEQFDFKAVKKQVEYDMCVR